MSIWDWVRAVAILGPITLMLLVGFSMAIRSGATYATISGGAKSTHGAWSRTFLTLGAYLVGLAILHALVGQQLPGIR
jgi:hypothetical protein